MPEIKNTFTSGKMNKDLDERLVPNGQYRDAMNVDISSSSTDNVGSVHNSYGNTRMDSSVIPGGFCVGSVVDKETQTIIWFASGTNHDAIAQYDPVSDKTFPILVSAKEGVSGAFLNFNQNRLITSINVMDGFLYWTDGYSEPKKANIGRCKAGMALTNRWTTITKFIGENGVEDGNILEKHLTIIKKYPLNAPKMDLSNSTRPGNSSSVLNLPQNTSFVSSEFGDGSQDKISNIYTRGSGSSQIIYNQDLEFKVKNAVAQYGTTITIDKTDSNFSERKWQSITTDWSFQTQGTNGYEKVSVVTYNSGTNEGTITCPFGIAQAAAAGSTITFRDFHEAYNNESFWTYKDDSGDLNIKPVGTSHIFTSGVKDGGILNDGSGENIVVDSSVVGGTRFAQGSSAPYNTKKDFDLSRLNGGSGFDASTGSSIPGLLTGHVYKVELLVTSFVGSGFIGIKQSSIGTGRSPRIEANGTVVYTFKALTNSDLQLQKSEDAGGTVRVSVTCLSGPREVKIQELVFQDTPDYAVGDIIKLTKQLPVNGYTEEDTANIRVKLTRQNLDSTGITAPIVPQGADVAYGGTGSSGAKKVFAAEIISIDSKIANLGIADAATGWEAEREKDESLFSNVFPRFAYRWKYLDNEYSAISPFTEVAFLPVDEEYNYDSKSGYNVIMENDVRSIALSDFQIKPNDVVELDILYKESNSTNIYTVKTLKQADGELDYSTPISYSITSELLQGLLPSNQLLRPYDNVPRKAKAQEITGNRLLYGNYTQQYNVPQSVSINAQINSKPIENNKATKSVKSIRNYQVGIGFLDKYGRQSPVFSSDRGIIELKQGESKFSSSISASMQSSVPSWATHYKFYVKDNSSEFYNLAMDRFYQAESQEHVWISFSSSDTNKVSIDDFIILKKQHDTQATLETPNTAKYKVLAKETSAPTFIKTKKVSLGRSAGGINFATNNIVTTDGYPKENSLTFTVRAVNISDFVQTFKEQSGVQIMENKFFKIGNAKSGATTDYYEIESVEWSVTETKAGAVYYTFKLKEPFGKDISLAGSGPGSSTRGLYVEFFEQTENKDLIEFEGRFFVKVLRDDVLNDNVLKAQSSENYTVINSQQMYWIHTYVRNAIDQSGVGWVAQTGPAGIQSSTQGNQSVASNLYNSTYLYDPARFKWITPVDTSSSKSKYDNTNLNTSLNNGSASNRFLAGTVDYNDYWIGRNVQGWAIDSAWSFHTIKSRDLNLHASGSNIANDTRNRYMGYGFIEGNNYCNFRCFNIGAGVVANYHKTDNGYEFPAKNKDIKNYDFFKALSRIGTKFRWSNDPGNLVFNPETGLEEYDGKSTVYTVLGSEIIDVNNVTTKFKAGQSNFDRRENKGIRIYLKLDKNITWSPSNQESTDIDNNSAYISALNGSAGTRQGTNTSVLEILQLDPTENTFSTKDPAIFETEPKERADLNLYYETPTTNIVLKNNMSISTTYIDPTTNASAFTSSAIIYSGLGNINQFQIVPSHITCTIPAGEEITISKKDENGVVEHKQTFVLSVDVAKYVGATFSSNRWVKTNGETCQIITLPKTTLKWHNCFSFGNGVESDRIRDDFNAVTIDKGPKVSATLDDIYKEEVKTNSIIYSGLYNKSSSLNNLNQFIQAEKITKDLNPEYGTIQKLFTRNTNVIAFCENKVLKILANKDALFNADGNTNVVATSKVLGQTVPFLGEFGISRNPESFANYGYRVYFADKDRNAVIRLSGDGLTDISKTGMASYFRDNLKLSGNIIGSYDEDKRLYNITLNNETVSFSEDVKGWTSRKSFVPEAGLSMDAGYYTFKSAKLWLHGQNELRNNFYSVQYSGGSTVKLIFNESSSIVKNFKTLSYEGTKDWYADSIQTDLQSGKIPSFVEKEGLWFNYIKGVATTQTNLDEKEFTTQGLGVASSVNLDGYPVYHEVVATGVLSSPTALNYFINNTTNPNNTDNVISSNHAVNTSGTVANIVFYIHSKILRGQKWLVKASNTTVAVSGGTGLTFGSPVLTNSMGTPTEDNYVICTIAVSGTMPNNPVNATVTATSVPTLIQTSQF